MLQADGSSTQYDGALKAPPLREFLQQYASEHPVGLDDADGSHTGGSANGASRQDMFVGTMIHNLSMANLSAIDANEEMWLIAFYSQQGAFWTPGYCVATACHMLLKVWNSNNYKVV